MSFCPCRDQGTFPTDFPEAGISPLVSISGITAASVTFCKFLSFLLPSFSSCLKTELLPGMATKFVLMFELLTREQYGFLVCQCLFLRAPQPDGEGVAGIHSRMKY